MVLQNTFLNFIKGPPQVKCRLLSSSIFDAMNFPAFFGKARNYVPAFPKNAENSLHQKC